MLVARAIARLPTLQSAGRLPSLLQNRASALSALQQRHLQPTLQQRACAAASWRRLLSTRKPPSTVSEDTSSSDSSDDDSSSSDDEAEGRKPIGKRGTSKFWLSKIRTYHRVMDVNKDGTVSWDDFKVMSDKFSELGHLNEQQQREFVEQLRYMWENNWGASDDPYCFITEESLMRSMEHAVNTRDLSKKVHDFLPYLFKAVDYNYSGDISVDEYKLLFRCLGLSEQDAIVSFNSIDINGDGSITLDEYVTHGRDFFLSEDETRSSKLFWGPLAR